jgi:opacity protein-like surface antigen
MKMRILILAAAILFALTSGGSATAQPALESRTRISGFISGLVGDGGTRPMFGISAGHRLTRFAGFEFDAAYASGLKLGEETRNLVIPAGGAIRPGDTLVCAIPEGCPITQTWHNRGSLFVVTTNAVIEIPARLSWLRPYLVAGAGAGNLSRDVDYTAPADPQRKTVHNTETSPVIDAGGGLEYQPTHGFAIGIEARYFRLFGTDARLRFARLGARVSFQF